MIYLDLFARFVLISLLAFGGGQAALPLVERVAVDEARWITTAMFGAAVAFAYLTPGPVLVIATFVGYHAAGIAGALTATVGAFLAPWVLAGLAAQQVTRVAQHPWLAGFRAGAAPAAVGLLGVTVLVLTREAIGTSWAHFAIVGVVLVVGAATRIHPVVLLACGGVLGYLIGGR